jgi:alpha-amylase
MGKENEIVNLFMDYETFGEHQKPETHIFEFLKALPEAVLKKTDFGFATPSEIAENYQPVAPMNVEYPISWADEERDVTAWLGNEMQKEAFEKLYDLSSKIDFIKDPKILRDWKYLQTSDHFYYMSTKILSDAAVHDYFNPYKSPYEAFINFMNVLSDFTLQVNKAYFELIPEEPADIEKKMNEYEAVISKLKLKLEEAESNVAKAAKPKAVSAKKEAKAIEKTKKTSKAAISKTKKEPKAIAGTKKEIKAIDKSKEDLKALPEKKGKAKRTKKEASDKEKPKTRKKKDE